MGKAKNCTADICIIGAGASGLAAAIRAKHDRPGLRVIIIEKNAQAGRKLRATGNGRCNITNTAAPGYERAVGFLESVGIAVRVYPNGLVYPHSESAADVAELLAARAVELGCVIALNTEVTAVSAPDGTGSFDVSCTQKGPDGIPEELSISSRVLILAAGGKAGPNFGTTGDSFRLARSLGHTVVRPVPVLTPVECAGDDPASIAGIRARGTVTLYRKRRRAVEDRVSGSGEERGDAETIFTEGGEIQFTKFGLSGICVFNMTRFMRFGREDGIEQFEIGVDLCPDIDAGGFLRGRRERAEASGSGETVQTLLRTLVKDRLAAYIMRRAGVRADRLIADMSDGELRRMTGCLRDLRFRPTGLKGWKEAQCTSGGVSLSEIDEMTCESKLVERFYITGEAADYDGPCGGYNLNNAWLTGMKAGRAAAASID